jgi:hypothetical protein
MSKLLFDESIALMHIYFNLEVLIKKNIYIYFNLEVKCANDLFKGV